MAGIAHAFVVLKFNVQKNGIIIGTLLAGVGVRVASANYAFSPNQELIADPTRLAGKAAASTSFWWSLIFIVLAGAGISSQIVTTRKFIL